MIEMHERVLLSHWRALLACHPAWRLLVPQVGAASFASRTPFDSISGLMRNRGFARVLAIVASRSDAEVASLLALAQINQDRQTYFARLLLLAYVTVPLTVFALAAQMSPAWLARIFEQYPSAIGGGMAGAGLAVVIAHVNEARARLLIAMLQVIRLVRAHPDPQGPR